MAIIEQISKARQEGKKLLAILVDPDKRLPIPEHIDMADIILVGGSTGTDTTGMILMLRKKTGKPIVIFPGNSEQFSKEADAILYLSLLSGRNADLLVGQPIRAARAVKESGIEAIPTGYILIDGGKESSVAKISHTQAMKQTDIRGIVDTAIAAELLGKRLVYLEAGSGAKTPVSIDIIRKVKEQVSIPIIVGGGICHPLQMRNAFKAGADIVVIGNHFESHAAEIPLFASNL